MKRVGKVGKANQDSRKIIASISESLGLSFCEIALKGCLLNWPLAPAHRHKRAWYKGDVAKLADIRQWVCACQYCHDKIEFNKELTEEVFMILRGQE